MQRGTTYRKLAKLLVVLIVALVIYIVVIAMTRSGETKVTFNAIPGDVKIRVSGQPSGKTNYLSPGAYTVTAEKKGYDKYTILIDVGDSPITVGLVPEPASPEALTWLEKNPKIQSEREAIGGQNAALKQAQADKRTPIVQYLPHTDVTGPYSIDYGPDPERPGYIILLVSNSTAKGRQEALEWIQDQGQKLSDIKIVFSDFVNPLAPQKEDR